MNFLDLNIGDEVVVSDGGFNQHDRIAKVERKTKNYVVVDERYYNSAGWLRGGDTWHRSTIHEITDEWRRRIATQNARAAVRNLLRNISVPNDYETAVEMYNALKPFVQKKESAT